MNSEAECDQINLAHIARKKNKNEETKTNKRQWLLSSVSLKLKIREGSPEGIRRTAEERSCERDELWPGYKSTTEGVIRAK